MMDTPETGIHWAVGALTGMVGWLTRRIFGKIDKLEKSQADHKLYAAENFVTKVDFKDVLTEIKGSLTRIETKIDAKADK